MTPANHCVPLSIDVFKERIKKCLLFNVSESYFETVSSYRRHYVSTSQSIKSAADDLFFRYFSCVFWRYSTNWHIGLILSSLQCAHMVLESRRNILKVSCDSNDPCSPMMDMAMMMMMKIIDGLWMMIMMVKVMVMVMVMAMVMVMMTIIDGPFLLQSAAEYL